MVSEGRFWKRDTQSQHAYLFPEWGPAVNTYAMAQRGRDFDPEMYSLNNIPEASEVSNIIDNATF